MGDYRSRHYEIEYRSRSFENDFGNGNGNGMEIVRAAQMQMQPYPSQLQPYGRYMDGSGAYYYKAPSKPKSSTVWGLSDPEMKRKKRVASYKAYTVEGKVKGSFRKGFRWLKNKYTEIVYGWW